MIKVSLKYTHPSFFRVSRKEGEDLFTGSRREPVTGTSTNPEVSTTNPSVAWPGNRINVSVCSLRQSEVGKTRGKRRISNVARNKRRDREEIFIFARRGTTWS